MFVFCRGAGIERHSLQVVLDTCNESTCMSNISCCFIFNYSFCDLWIRQLSIVTPPSYHFTLHHVLS